MYNWYNKKIFPSVDIMARLAKEGIGLNKDGKLVQNNPRGLLPYEKERSGR